MPKTNPVGGSGRGKNAQSKDQEYVVQPGDSFASIAGKMGGDQRKFQNLARQNGYIPAKYDNQGNLIADAVLPVLQPGQTIKIPGGFGYKWDDVYVGQGFVNQAQDQASQYGWRMGPEAASQLRGGNALPASGYDPLRVTTNGQIGYTPSYWETPTVVNRWYTYLLANPGKQLPGGIDAVKIETAFNWWKEKQGDDPTKWSPLSYDDPARDFLSKLPLPPAELLLPDEQKKFGAALFAQNAAAQKMAAPVGPETGGLKPGDLGYDWSKVPAWQKVMFDVMSDPSTTPAVMGGAIGTVTAGPVGGLIGAGIGGVVGVAGNILQKGNAGEAVNVLDIFPGQQVLTVALLNAIQGTKIDKASVNVVPNTSGSVAQLASRALETTMLPAQLMEQGIGTTSQVIESATHPEQYGNLQDFDWKAAWNASQMLGEAEGANMFGVLGNIPPAVQWGMQRIAKIFGSDAAWTNEDLKFTKPGEVFKLGEADPQKIDQGNDVSRMLAVIREDMQTPGADPEEVLAQWRDTFGFSGTISDLAIQAAIDPLNRVGDVEALAGKGAAKITGKPELAAAFDFVSGTHDAGLIGGVKEYRARVNAGKVDLSTMGGFERWLARITPEGMPKERMAVTPKNRFDAFIKAFTELTPQSKAKMGLASLRDGTGLIADASMVGGQIDPATFARKYGATADIDYKAAADVSEAVLGGPETYANMPAMRAGKKIVNEQLLLWDTINAPGGAREILYKTAAALGITPNELIQKFRSDPTQAGLEFTRLLERAAQSADEAAKSLVDMAKAGEFTADTLKQALEVFEKPGIPHDPAEWYGKVANLLDDHYQKWLVDYYKLKPDPELLQWFQNGKQAMNLTLLSLNPGYALNNVISNQSTRIFEGVGGWMPPWRIKEILGPDGFNVTPSRIGDAGMPFTGEVAKTETGAIGDALRGKGWAAKVGSGLRKIGKYGPMTQLSALAESSDSAQAMVIALKDHWARSWKRGVGFTKMHPALEKTINERVPGGANMVYAAIEAGMNLKHLDDIMTNAAVADNLHAHVTDAAARVGIPEADMMEMLQKTGIWDDINTRLKSAKTMDEKLRAFDAAIREARRRADQAMGMAAVDNVRMTVETIRAEGPGAAVEAWADAVMLVSNKWQDSVVKSGEMMQKLYEIPFDQRRAVVEAFRITDAQEWARTRLNERSIINGIMEAFGMDEVRAREIDKAMIANHTGWDNAYKAKWQALDAFWKTEWKDNAQRADAWDRTQAKINAIYDATFKNEVSTQAKFAQLVGEGLGQKYGANVAEPFKKAWNGANEFRRAQWAKQQEFIKYANTLNTDAKRVAWTNFNDQKMRDIAEWRRQYMVGLDGMQRGMNGEPVPAGTPPAPITGGSDSMVQPELLSQSTAEAVKLSDADIRAQKAMHEAEIFKIAHDAKLFGTNPDGTPVLGVDDLGFAKPDTKLDMMKIVKGNGGAEGAHIRTFDDITPELLKTALENKAQREAMQIPLDEARNAIGNTITRPENWDARLQDAIKSGKVDPEIRGRILDIPAKMRTDLEMDVVETMLTHDQLVGLGNKAAFEQRVALGKDLPIKVSLDLDFLKWFNDNGGHKVGDQLITDFANMLQKYTISPDDAYRLGGDEFAAMFPDETTAQAAITQIKAEFANDIIEFAAVDSNGHLRLDENGQPLVWSGKGLSFGHGTGTDFNSADLVLTANKRLAREQRGIQPAGYTLGVRKEIEGNGQAVRPTGEDNQAGRSGLRSGEPGFTEPGSTEQALTPYQVLSADVENLPLSKIPAEVERDIRVQLEALRGEAKYGGKSIIEFIAERGGILPKDLSEIGADIKYPKLSNGKGLPLDQMLLELQDAGYVPKPEGDISAQSVDINAVREAIKADYAGMRDKSGTTPRVYSMFDEQRGTAKWFKNLKVGKKEANVSQTIDKLLAGLDDASYSKPASATERAIKREAFTRATETWDSSIDQARKEFDGLHPNDYDSMDALTERTDRMVQSIPDYYRQLFPEKWQELATFRDELWEAQNKALENLQKAQDQAEIGTFQDESAVKFEAAKDKANLFNSQAEVKKALIKKFGYDDATAEASSALVEARAQTWATLTGKSPNEWYRRSFSDILGPDEAMPAQRYNDAGEPLYQIQAVNREMTGAEVDNYARALVRSGADELRRAVSYETDKSSRIAILDAAHKLDPAMAEGVAKQTSDLLFQEAYQRQKTKLAGQIGFFGDEKNIGAVIQAMKGADPSTFVHEFGHMLRRDLYRTLDETGADWIKADIDTLEQHFGVKDGKWKPKHEEQFARTWEKYLADGQAPTTGLQGVFDHFKAVMAQIYRQITGNPIDVTISPEVRQVFDRLIAEQPEAPQSLGTVGGLLPGMGDATGMMMDVQPGTGRINKMQAPNARSIYDVVPGKKTIDVAGADLNPGDIVRAKGKQYAVKGVNAQGQVVTMDGSLLNAADVKRIGAQTDLFAQEQPVNPFDADPKLPIGGLQGVDGTFPQAQILDEAYSKHLIPAIEALKEAYKANGGRAEFKFGDLDPQTLVELNKYLREKKAEMPGNKLASMRWAEMKRDDALLNYGRRTQAGKLLDVFAPYRFFATESAYKWALRAIDKPQLFANYARAKQFMSTYEANEPDRLKGKIRIPVPFLPEWAGGGIYIDPMRQIYSFSPLLTPFEAMERDAVGETRNAEYIIRQKMRDGTIEEAAANAALKEHTGVEWERALTQAKAEGEAEISTPMDFLSTFMSPALYLSAPLNALGVKVPFLSSGDKNDITPTPGYRLAKGLQAATSGTPWAPVGDIAEVLARPEGWARKQLGLTDYGKWGDYYVDRQLANMVAEGYPLKLAQAAMMERTGPMYDEAMKRVRQEQMLKQPLVGAVYGLAHGNIAQSLAAAPGLLFSGGLLPTGELEIRGDKAAYNEAWTKYKAGDKNALTAFFEAHPEYEARLALYDTPEERMRQFMVSEIWDKYMGLGTYERKQAVTQLGKDFEQSFLDKETRSYDGLTVDKLAMWARVLGGYVPGNEKMPVAGVTPDVYNAPMMNMPDPQLAAVMNAYYDEREQKFPDYYKLQTEYYAKPENERRSYLLKNPSLKSYWDWNRAYKEQHPEVALVNETTGRKVDLSLFNGPLMEQLTWYTISDVPLTSGGQIELRRIWESLGKPTGKLQTWLDSQVVPTMLTTGASNGNP